VSFLVEALGIVETLFNVINAIISGAAKVLDLSTHTNLEMRLFNGKRFVSYGTSGTKSTSMSHLLLDFSRMGSTSNGRL
jgi:hypothetical protein